MGALSLALLLAPVPVAMPVAVDPVDRWRGYIGEASLRFGVPSDWIARVMRAESGGRTLRNGRPIRSPKGAIGLMQLMPGTWAEMRGRLGLGADPDDPRDNILAGTAYLRLMYDRFGYPGLFAAYHAGPGRYAAYLRGEARLPRATIAYLVQLTGTATAPPPVPQADVQGGDREARDPLFAVRVNSGSDTVSDRATSPVRGDAAAADFRSAPGLFAIRREDE